MLDFPVAGCVNDWSIHVKGIYGTQSGEGMVE